jgi:hypothetical protein
MSRVLPIDHEQIRRCRDEVERVLFRVANHDDCKRFHEETQLTAVVFLLVRCASLLDSLVLVFQSRNLDGFHPILRAFEEAWNLAHELRLNEQHAKAIKWLAEANDTYLASISVLNEFVKSRGQHEPPLGRDYGSLSELSHPTRSAAMNSVGVALLRLGSEGAEVEFRKAEENDRLRIPYALHRLIWLMIDQDPRFIPLPVDTSKMPLSMKFFEEYGTVAPPHEISGQHSRLHTT